MAASPGRFATESSRRGPRATEILDEAVSLLRQAPPGLLSIYYAGALPFCLALVYFHFDMTQGLDAESHLAGAALLLTGLYFWMKTCQAVFARRLLAQLEGEEAEPWNPRRWARTALLQIIYAGSYVVVYPLALLIMFPFGWVSAFYHNISIVATGARSTVRSSWAEALELSRLWPKQNHAIGAILLGGLLVLALNLATFFALIPAWLNMFLGIRTILGENESAWNNSSFYLDVLVCCFLIVNPLNKAIYALRCFYGRARLSGADLTAELRRRQRARQQAAPVRVLAVLAFLALASFAAPLEADDTAPPVPVAASPAAARLDHAIQTTLQKDEFTWRRPQARADTGDEGAFTRGVDGYLAYCRHQLGRAARALGRFVSWLFASERKHDDSGRGWTALQAVPWRLLFLGVVLLAAGCLIFVLTRFLRDRSAPPKTVLASAPAKIVDLEADNVRADELPEDSWLALAHDLIERGELRLALRALYLASLSVLAQGQLVRLAPAKSNRDYLLELTRRLRGNPAAVPFFRDNIGLFEASWYGTHAVTSAIIETMLANHQQVRSHAAA